MNVSAQQSKSKRYSSPAAPIAAVAWLMLALRKIKWRITAHYMTRPRFFRTVFAFLRFFRPILILGRTVIVTRNEDVKTVLHNGDEFTLAEIAEPTMLSGGFLLNNDWPQQHDREEVAVMRGLNRPRDRNRIRKITEAACTRVMQSSANDQEIDAVHIGNEAALDVVQHYFGIPPSRAGKNEMLSWLHQLAGAILTLPPKGSDERFITERSADDMCIYISELIKERTRELRNDSALSKDTVLDRLITLKLKQSGSIKFRWISDDWIRRMISGLIIFGMATIVRTASDIIDELLNRPTVLADAVATANKTAKSGTTRNSNERAKLLDFAYEALRFRPMLPVLARYVPRDTTLVGEYEPNRRIPAGATVICPPISAMFDRKAIDSPRKFNIARPSSDYLVFGWGMHKCIGQFIADEELVEILRSLLCLKNLRRANGRAGKIKYDGPAARSLKLKYDI